MLANGVTARADGAISWILRGGGALAGLGAVLGGIAGSIDWPLVGTLFGAVEGALVGVVVGVFDGVVLRFLARFTRSARVARVASGAVAGAAAAGAASLCTAPIDVPTGVALALVGIGLLLGAALGPQIAYGAGSLPGGQSPGARASLVVGRYLRWGASLGAAAGAVSGLVVGTFVYLPTCAFAGVEGAVFGLVGGVVLALLATAAVTFAPPLLRAHR
ncbi:hypothetical protein ACIREE_38280 [Streptomyces sp. NPDC102467]|uniref:hypothetical protein n=1 Tax=Streptomyces sp. NPDC102467 TaxID=3366179 RepID=UPI0037F83E33